MSGLRSVVLVAGTRTPFQRAGTGYRDLMSHQLAAVALGGLLQQTGLPATAVDRVLLGATVPNPLTPNVAREAALTAGIPATVPAVTLTAAGASATAAVTTGADLIATGQAEVVLAGGTDCISDPPIRFRRPMRRKLLAARRLRGPGGVLRFLASLRPGDFLPERLAIAEFTTGQSMGEYSEELAGRLGITRQAQDEYAAGSHRRAAAARDDGHLAAEITAVELPEAGASAHEDNGIRSDTTPERLARLRPAFAADGTLTAGNSSFLTDGAAALLLMSEERAREMGLEPLARLRGHHLTAHDLRTELLLGPAFAIPRLLDGAGLGLADIDVFEIHEAFAAQILAVVTLLASADFGRRELGRDGAVGELPLERLNRWGGSLALGNPFAPNGARLLTTAARRLRKEDGRLAVVATCAGGALGHALLLERVP